MADSILRLKVESQEYDNKLKQATNGLTRYIDECRKVGGTLEVVEKGTLDYVRAIGQMDTSVTPLQLAIQAMTLANKGTRYKAHIIKEIRTYDDKNILSLTKPEIASQFEIKEENHRMICEYWGGYTRHNEIYQLAYDMDGNFLEKNLVVKNSAIMMYSPFLSDTATRIDESDDNNLV